jgi:hypothetical protein
MAVRKETPQVGKRYGKLTITKDLGSIVFSGKKKSIGVEVVCDCGVVRNYRFAPLRVGKALCCGCTIDERRKERLTRMMKPKNAFNKSLHSVWFHMNDRCYNPKEPKYNWYGGRGVQVCDEWRYNSKAFRLWAYANGWEKGLQLDKDIKGAGKLYSPETCCFVTRAVNNRNKRDNVIVEYNGESMCVTDWAKRLGLKHDHVQWRINKWGIEKALTTPVKKYNRSANTTIK